MNILASEMAKRVRTQRITRKYSNVDRFMHIIEQMFIESNARPISVIVSGINVDHRLHVLTPGDDSPSREASLTEIQDLIHILGFPSNGFRCRDGEGLSGEHMLQVCLPHPLS